MKDLKRRKAARPPAVPKPVISETEYSHWKRDFVETTKWGRDMEFAFTDTKTGKVYRVQFSRIDLPIFKDPKYSDEFGCWIPRSTFSVDRDGYLRRGGKKVHALIMKPPKGVEVGHIDPDDKLDLRRTNLRLVVHDLNQRESGIAVRLSNEMMSPCPHVYPLRRRDGTVRGWNVNVATREPMKDEKGQAVIHSAGPQTGKPKLIGVKLKSFSASKFTLEEVMDIAAKFERIRYEKVLREQRRLTGEGYVDLDALDAVPSFGIMDPAILRSKRRKKEWVRKQGYKAA